MSDADRPAIPLLGPASMMVGWWTEMPLDDDDAPVWAQIVRLLPPAWTREDRWAVHLRRGATSWWVKCAPSRRFPVCDVDPSGLP